MGSCKIGRTANLAKDDLLSYADYLVRLVHIQALVYQGNKINYQ
jgi:hypothetical protein